MKKKYLSLIIIVVGLLISFINVDASTYTNIRSEYDYLVPSGIEVTDENRENVLSTPAVNASEKIYDFAELLSYDEEDKLYDEVTKFIDDYNMDLAIVTIDSNTKTPMEYADDFYDYNDFGIGSKRDGVLFLIDMDNREIWMSTTGSAIKMYNDSRIDEALDSVYQYMSDKDYYEGISSYIEIISDYALSGYPTGNSSKAYSKKEKIVGSLLKSMGISLVVTIVVMVVLILKNKMARKATTAAEYLDKDSVEINNLGDVLISSNTVRHKIDHSSGGGSSTHHGSSGISHGGGGHRF